MRLKRTTLLLTIIPAPAFAHPSHISIESGHTHYLIIGAAVIALAIGVGAFMKAKRSKDV